MSKVWLITGASRGLGRAFTQAVLDAGDRVIATAASQSNWSGLRADIPREFVLSRWM